MGVEGRAFQAVPVPLARSSVAATHLFRLRPCRRAAVATALWRGGSMRTMNCPE